MDDKFVFNAEDFEDAVVMPSYRNIDQPQYFYVAEIRSDLNPMSPFPSPELYKTFAEYYATKYGLGITNPDQPLLDVDHTSARLNLLIPRYMNQKGVPLPTSSAETKKARRENLQQKQILVPELCDIHVFLASLWRKAVCLPAILYRMNYLLLGEEIRKHVSFETKIGISHLSEDYRFPKLDFGIDTSPEHLKMFSTENGTNDKDNDEDDVVNDQTSGSDAENVDDSNIENVVDERDSDDEDVDSICKDVKDKCNLNCHVYNDDYGRSGSHLQDSQCNKYNSSAISNAEEICDSTMDSVKKIKAFQNSTNEDKNEEFETDDKLGKLKACSGRCDEMDKVENQASLQNGFSEHLHEVENTADIKASPNIYAQKIAKSEQPYTVNGYVVTENTCKNIESIRSKDNTEIPTKQDEQKKESENEHHEGGSYEVTEDREAKIEPADIFKDVGKFDCGKEPSPSVNINPEPLISLDEDMDLSTFIGPSPCEILQGLTMSNANDFFSLERLETIGDSFLKYAITVYLYCSYPGIHEGKLSYLRSKQVSNYNLYRLGKRKCLAECMISTKFEPYENWLPPGYVINEDRRKGPVPKVYVAPINRSSSSVFSCAKDKEYPSKDDEATDKKKDKQQGECSGFETELEEADQISRAKDEEFQGKDKSDAQMNFIPYSLQLHHCLPDKSIADCVEALIGCYLTSCDKMAALRLMSWMGLKVLPKRKQKEELDVRHS